MATVAHPESGRKATRACAGGCGRKIANTGPYGVKHCEACADRVSARESLEHLLSAGDPVIVRLAACWLGTLDMDAPAWRDALLRAEVEEAVDRAFNAYLKRDEERARAIRYRAERDRRAAEGRIPTLGDDDLDLPF